MSGVAKAAFIILAVFLVWMIWIVGVALYKRRFHVIYHHHLAESRRERLFLSSLAFFLTFATVRLITFSIHSGIGPFHDNVTRSGLHIHHLVYGILGLLLIGYLWLAQIGTGAQDASVWAGRITALLFGVAAALTLDEFALWLNLADVYWSPQGRASLRAAFYFGSLLSVGFWGGPLLHGLTRHALGLGPVKSNQ